MQEFKAEVPETEIEDLRNRLANARLPDQIEGSGWGYGTDRAALEEWVAYWHDDFDWRAVEARFNAYAQFVTEAEGERVHFLHARSPVEDATPLLITHGWPGSVVEFLDIIEPLRNPAAHGGSDADAFHVVCPHIPGFGYSGPTRQAGFDLNRAAAAIANVMQQLGYDRYIAQGGDWGSVLTRRLAEAFPEKIIGAHFNMLFAFPEDMTAPKAWEGVTPEERDAFISATSKMGDSQGYSEIQGTKPQTLAYAMHDSAVGHLAWHLEKFHAWCDPATEFTDAFSKDHILANVALYWFTNTANSASRLYCESKRAKTYPGDPWTGTVNVPIGHCSYPGELTQTPRAWADKRYKNIIHWTKADRGGHFAAFENPEFFTRDLRAFAQRLRE
ncbi:MAG: epoxide hydrolase family protein [Myxococcota bacterium]